MGKYHIGWKIVRQVMRIRAGFAFEFGSDSHGFVGIRLDSRSNKDSRDFAKVRTKERHLKPAPSDPFIILKGKYGAAVDWGTVAMSFRKRAQTVSMGFKSPLLGGNLVCSKPCFL